MSDVIFVTGRSLPDFIFVTGRSLPEAYHRALSELNSAPIVDCKDWNTRTKDATLSMIVNEPLREPMISKWFPGGPEDLQQYVMEVCDGILDFEIANGKLPYTYHDRYAEQYTKALEILKNNKSSRRAVMDIRRVEDIEGDDVPCLQYIQFLIDSDGRLDMHVLFRSNDGFKATFMNAFALIMLQKKTADILGVPIGKYYHVANSFHCYEKDWEKLESFKIQYWKYSIDVLTGEDLTYRYEGDWDELMTGEIDKINEKVNNLRPKKKKRSK